MDEPFDPPPEDDDEERLVRHLTSHNNHHAGTQSSMSPPFTGATYRGTSPMTLDPTLQQAKLGMNKNYGAQVQAGRSSPLNPQHHHGAVASPGAVARPNAADLTANVLFASTSMDPPSALSPSYNHTPDGDAATQPQSYSSQERTLPTRDVTDDNLDDAYVAFILYCNPVVAPSTDSTELRRGFWAPPKSDGKTFNTYTLLELIRKFENKEIKTWTQLAIQLGVEPPVMEKNQSAQKVQQYAVRLKRWMHAMHVDAFFEYCLGKPHSYYTQVPPVHAPYPEFGRDGVPLEEDLALRALHPESRPKRGRRKTEDKDHDADRGSITAKRPHLDTSVGGVGMQSFGGPPSSMFQNSANTPSTAPTDEMERYGDHLDPWTAASAITPVALSASPAHPHSAHPASGASGGQQFRWRLKTRDPNTPLTPHPRSAVTPSTAGQPPDSGFDEPLSAVTPSTPNSKGRTRRRHGPAVSSAWPSSGNPVTGKLRGRPPSNRSVRDGPFSTFPANPKMREGPVIDLQGSTPVSTPIVGRQEGPNPFDQTTDSGSPSNQGKPGGLHLKVPQHTGGVVRLATPTVVLNGALERALSPSAGGSAGDRRPSSTLSDDRSVEASSDPGYEQPLEEPYKPPFRPKHRLEVLARLLTAKICNSGRKENEPQPIDTKLAQRLAGTALAALVKSQKQPTTEEDIVVPCAVWLGLTSELGLPSAFPGKMRDIEVHALESSGGPRLNGAGSDKSSREEKSASQIPSSYRLSWFVDTGPLVAEMALNVDLPKEPASPSAEPDTAPTQATDEAADESTWKQKYLALQRERDEAVAQMKRKVLEAVL